MKELLYGTTCPVNGDCDICPFLDCRISAANASTLFYHERLQKDKEYDEWKKRHKKFIKGMKNGKQEETMQLNLPAASGTGRRKL